MGSILIKNLHKAFGENTVIPELSLVVKENELVSLLGPSGCGKTTLLRMVAGLDSPTRGEIRIGELEVFNSQTKVSLPPERRNLGMVFQSYAIWPHMSVMENITFPLKCRKVEKKEMEERAWEALEQVQLKGLEKRYPHQLSGGQQQRVALARALVARPQVLLLDEPLSNLDANLRMEMCEEISRLRKNYPVTTLFVTHDQKEAFRLSDRIALINKGQIEQLATEEEIRKKPSSDFVSRFLGL